MVLATLIKEHMPIVDSNGVEFAIVDHLDGDTSVKITKDETGNHHWIPLEWVSRVDAYVHLNRPSDQVIREWSDRPLQTTL
jgi:hypothetical protein